ncbi:MAG: FtsW/RodA/SpoVE family cell cycle protein [Chloroflexia bacterium]|nr:FtsW/RodA/SpoVE family cell cycle protein [Chloroflexia bacterium]
MESEQRRRWWQRIRWQEMLLLLPAPALLAAGLAQLALLRGGAVSAEALRPALWTALVLWGCSLLLSLSGFRGDQTLLPLAALLSTVGLLFIDRLEPAVIDRYGAVAQKQWRWAALGLAAFMLTLLLTRRWVWRGRVFSWDVLLKRYRYLVLLSSLSLVALTMFFGLEVNGAVLWLRLGPFQFQPSELLKLALVVFLAAYLEDKRDLITFGGFHLGPLPMPPLPYLLPLLLMEALALAVLVFQRDLGAAMLTLGIFLAMLYLASSRLVYLVGGGLGFVGAVVAIYQVAERIAFLSHVRTRITVWLWPWNSEGAYQVVQGLYAFASGGLLGQGLGQGYPSLIPESHTDFVFAAVGEEWGLLGSTGLLFLYILLVGRGLVGSLRARDGFLQLLGSGLAIALALQTGIIMAGNLGLVPLTGITLPFISYGGTSLVTNWVMVALLLRISVPARPR